MGFITDSDVKKLTEDRELMAEVAKAIVQDPEAMDNLADDIADKLEDELGDNPELRKQIVDAGVANPEFKKRIVKKLADELS